MTSTYTPYEYPTFHPNREDRKGDVADAVITIVSAANMVSLQHWIQTKLLSKGTRHLFPALLNHLANKQLDGSDGSIKDAVRRPLTVTHEGVLTWTDLVALVAKDMESHAILGCLTYTISRPYDSDSTAPSTYTINSLFTKEVAQRQKIGSDLMRVCMQEVYSMEAYWRGPATSCGGIIIPSRPSQPSATHRTRTPVGS